MTDDRIEAWLKKAFGPFERRESPPYPKDIDQLLTLVRLYRAATTDCIYDLSLNLGCPQCQKNDELMGMNRAAEQNALKVIDG